MTKPARMLVRELMIDIDKVSLLTREKHFYLSFILPKRYTNVSNESFCLLLENIVVEVVVTGHCHEGAKTDPNRVEDLSCSIHPYL